MFNRFAFLSLFLIAACGGSSQAEPAEGARTQGPGIAEDAGQQLQPIADGSVPSDPTDAGPDSSSPDAGQDSSVPGAFSASCGGNVEQGAAVAWTYVVDDSSGSSVVHATIQIDFPGAPLCTGEASFPAPAAFSDWVTVPCGTGSWTLGLDRGALKVDIRYDGAEGTQASWLPNCH